MRWRITALVILSNPTLDKVVLKRVFTNEKKRMGGPPYFASIYNPDPIDKTTVAIGASDSREHHFFYKRLLKEKLTPVLEYTGCTQEHYLIYSDDNNRLVWTPLHCRLPSEAFVLKELCNQRQIDAGIANPTTIGDPVDFKTLLILRKTSRIFFFDLQGIARRKDFLHLFLVFFKGFFIDVAHASLEEIKTIGRTLGVTVNDIPRYLGINTLIITDSWKPLKVYGKNGMITIQPPLMLTGSDIDSTGAGDVLLYALAYYMLEGHPLDALRKAIALSSLHVAYWSGFTEKPDRHEVEEKAFRTKIIL